MNIVAGKGGDESATLHISLFLVTILLLTK